MMKRRPKSNAGFSIVEMSIAATILTLTIVPLMTSMQSSVDSHASVMTRDNLEERIRKVAARLVHYLRGAGAETIDAIPEWPATTQSISFKRAVTDALDAAPAKTVGFLEEVVEKTASPKQPTESEKWAHWEHTTTLAFSGGKLELATGGRTISLGNGLTNATFSRDGRKLIATLRMDGKDAQGDPISVTRRIHVTVRN